MPRRTPTSSKKSTQTPQYGDHSSTYWPAGWDFKRYSTASRADLLSLPDGELAKTQAGLREVLGEDGVADLAEWMFQLEQKRGEEKEAAEGDAKEKAENERSTSATLSKEIGSKGGKDALAALTPNWLQQWSKRYKETNQEWGFVVMRVCCYDNEERWKDFQARFQEIVEIPFRREEERSGVEEARNKFKIHWVESPDLDGASKEALREKYTTLLPTLPALLSYFPVFFCASSASISSVLSAFSATSTSTPPSPTSPRFRPNAPYILAVSTTPDSRGEEDDEERLKVKEIFKVAVEVLIDELWWVLDADFMEMRGITRAVRAVDINEDREEGDAQEHSDGLEDIWWSTAPSPERLRKRRRVA